MTLRSVAKLFLSIAAMFFVLLLSGHYLGVCIPGIKTYVAIVGSFFAIAIICSKPYTFLRRSTLLNVVICVIAIAVLSLVANMEFEHLISYYCFIFYPVFALILVKLVGFGCFRKYYKVFLTVACIASLAATFLHSFLGLDLNFYGNIKSVTDATYANSILFTYNTAPYTSYRSYGLFWEPGLWATFLIIGIIFESMEERMSIWNILLYGASLYFTYSAAGYFLFVLAFFAVLFRRKGSLQRNIAAITVVLSLVALYLVFEVPISNIIKSISPALYSKFYGSESTFIFNTSRIASFSYCWDIFVDRPFFGAGLVHSNILYEESEIALTSTSVFMMSMFGILGAGYTLLWLYGIFKRKDLNIVYRIILAIVFLLILNKEPHHQNLFMWIVLFYFLDYKKRDALRFEETINEKSVFCR